MASVSLPRRKNLSAQQALAWLQEMDEADSDGGEISFVQQAGYLIPPQKNPTCPTSIDSFQLCNTFDLMTRTRGQNG
ncbi:uncharacterized protein LOC102077797 [Tachysurus ichikawai]